MPPPILNEVVASTDALAAKILGIMPGAGVMVLDADLRVTLMEGQAFQRSGYDAESAVGRDVLDVVPAAAWAKLRPHWAAALHGVSRAVEVTSVDERRHYWIHFAPLANGSGDASGACMVTQDITGRVRDRQQLHRRLNQQSAAASLGSMALQDRPLPEILDKAVRIVASALRATSVVVVEDTQEQGVLLRASSGPPEEGVCPWSDEVLKLFRDRREPLFVSNVSAENGAGMQELDRAGLISLAGTPIGAGDRRYGYLAAGSDRSGAFSSEDLAFMESIANIVMAAVERKGARQRVSHAESRLAEFWELSLDLLAVVSPDGHFLDVGGAWEQTLGWTRDDLIGHRALDFILREDHALMWTEADPPDGVVPEVLHRYRAKDGSVHTLLWSVRWAPDGCSYGVAKDVTTRQREQELVLERAEQFDQAQRYAKMGSWEIDLVSGRHVISPSLRDILCLETLSPAPELVSSRVHPDDRAIFEAGLAKGVLDGPVQAGAFRIVLPDGTIRHMESRGEAVTAAGGQRIALRGMVRDVTEEHRSEKANRLSEERFSQGFDNAPIGMALVDPDDRCFLRVNKALCKMVGRTDAELVGMPFLAITHPDDVDATVQGQASLGTEGQNYFAGEKRYLKPDGTVVWISLNVSVVRDQDGGVDVFFGQMVDITALKAEEAALREQVAELSWLGDITKAFEENRFELHEQPIVDLRTGETIQHELLLRMRSPSGALIAPGDFLPAAEKYGAIGEIDRWVISRGAELAAQRKNIEINLSGVSICDPELITFIVAELERTGADPAALVFEITETALLRGKGTATRLAEQLRERGCRFALDDFGTGYAGFHYLKTLPLDFLKIDREFVSDALTHEPDLRVIEAVVGLAKGFGLKTIAEGVEDEDTLALLLEKGVDLAQGFYLGRPSRVTLVGE